MARAPPLQVLSLQTDSLVLIFCCCCWFDCRHECNSWESVALQFPASVDGRLLDAWFNQYHGLTFAGARDGLVTVVEPDDGNADTSNSDEIDIGVAAVKRELGQDERGKGSERKMGKMSKRRDGLTDTEQLKQRKKRGDSEEEADDDDEREGDEEEEEEKVATRVVEVRFSVLKLVPLVEHHGEAEPNEDAVEPEEGADSGSEGLEE